MKIIPEQEKKQIISKLQESDAASETIIKNNKYEILLIHVKKGQSTEAELHENANDIYFVQEGNSTITIGGEIINKKESAPGEWRGTNLEGREQRELQKGDIVSIPKNTPHMISFTGDLTWTVVKIYE